MEIKYITGHISFNNIRKMFNEGIITQNNLVFLKNLTDNLKDEDQKELLKLIINDDKKRKLIKIILDSI